MFVSFSTKKLRWALGLSLGLASISAFSATAQAQQATNTASRAKPRPIVADPKESQQTIQQYRQATASAAPRANTNPVKTADVRQAQHHAKPNYQRSPATMLAEEPAPVQQAGHHAHSHGARRTYIDDPTIMPMDEGCTSCGTGGCGPEGCDSGCIGDCLPCNYWSQNGWYVGGEYLYARVNYSEPTAYFQRTVVVDADNNSFITDQNVPYNIDYQSTYRAYAGYRWGSCGESINFGLFNFNNGTSFTNVMASPPPLVIAGQLETNPAPGQRLVTGLDTSATTYDLDYSKRIPICSCNSDPCDCCECPPWSITWNAGARVGDVEINSPTDLYNADGSLVSTGNAQITFVGAGPKAGIEGRRHFGHNYRWSAYGKSNIALLLGQYDVTLTKFTPVAQTTSLQTYSFDRIVPVIDLEVGLSRQIGKRTLLTAGYFFQAWIDVSTINTIQFVGNLNDSQIDTANMMSFDGFMLRIEHTF